MTRMTAIGVVAGAVLPALMGSLACSRPRAANEAAERPSVSVAKVVTGDLAQALTLAAEFRPYQEIEVHAKVAGYVKAINVDVGDRVSWKSRSCGTTWRPPRRASNTARKKSTVRRPISRAPNRVTRSRISDPRGWPRS